MKFRDLQRFFSGELTEEEKLQLCILTHNSKGRMALAVALEEGWNESANQRGNHDWDPDSCLDKILKKITLEHHQTNF